MPRPEVAVLGPGRGGPAAALAAPIVVPYSAMEHLMIEHFVASLVASIFCLSFAATRKFGVVGLALLICIRPMLSLALLLSGGVAVLLIRHYLRRKFNVLPRRD